MMHTCPTCGHTARTPKPKPVIVTGDTSTMTDAQLYEHYKRIAHIEDVRFNLVHGMKSDALRAKFAGLLTAAETGQLKRAETLRQLSILQGDWRHERNVYAQSDAGRAERAVFEWGFGPDNPFRRRPEPIAEPEPEIVAA